MIDVTVYNRGAYMPPMPTKNAITLNDISPPFWGWLPVSRACN